MTAQAIDDRYSDDDRWNAVWEAFDTTEALGDADMIAARDEMVRQGLAAAPERVDALLRFCGALQASVWNSLVHQGTPKHGIALAITRLATNAGVEPSDMIAIAHIKNLMQDCGREQ